MDKPRFRYNHKTGKLDKLYTINPNVAFVNGFVNPDSSHRSFEVIGIYEEMYRCK